MPLLVATVETLAEEAPEPLLHKDPHPKHYHGRCSRRHVYVFVCVFGQISMLATRNSSACVLFVLHASLSPLSGIACCLSLKTWCCALRKEYFNYNFNFVQTICCSVSIGLELCMELLSISDILYYVIPWAVYIWVQYRNRINRNKEILVNIAIYFTYCIVLYFIYCILYIQNNVCRAFETRLRLSASCSLKP